MYIITDSKLLAVHASAKMSLKQIAKLVISVLLIPPQGYNDQVTWLIVMLTRYAGDTQGIALLRPMGQIQARLNNSNLQSVSLGRQNFFY